MMFVVVMPYESAVEANTEQFCVVWNRSTTAVICFVRHCCTAAGHSIHNSRVGSTRCWRSDRISAANCYR